MDNNGYWNNGGKPSYMLFHLKLCWKLKKLKTCCARCAATLTWWPFEDFLMATVPLSILFITKLTKHFRLEQEKSNDIQCFKDFDTFNRIESGTVAINRYYNMLVN